MKKKNFQLLLLNQIVVFHFFVIGLTRAPMYPFSTGQYAYPMLSPEMTQVASW